MGADEDIRPLRPRERATAAAFLFEAYRTDPRFAELYGVRSADELDGIAPLFRQQIEQMRLLPGATLGCFHGNRLVGAICYCPDQVLTRLQMLRAVLRRPLLHARFWIHGAVVKRRYRQVLRPTAAQRWASYTAMTSSAPAGSPPRLRVMSLGVAATARRCGVARRLLAAIAAEPHWQGTMAAVEVNTWHRENVSIYERLGFHTVLHGERDGVECWTMRRAIAPAGPTQRR